MYHNKERLSWPLLLMKLFREHTFPEVSAALPQDIVAVAPIGQQTNTPSDPVCVTLRAYLGRLMADDE